MHRLPLKVECLNRKLRGQALVVLVAADIPNRVVGRVLPKLPLGKLPLLQAAIIAAPARNAHHGLVLHGRRNLVFLLNAQVAAAQVLVVRHDLELGFLVV